MSARRSATGLVSLLHDVAERLGIDTDPIIARDDGHQLRRLAKQFCGCQMYGVECAHRFHRERSSGTREYRRGHADDGAATLERSQSSKGRAFFFDGQSARNTGSDKSTGGFGERQSGGDAIAIRLQCRERRRFLFEQRGQESARLNVSE